MKKIICFILCTIMLFTVAACGTEKSENSAEQQTAAPSEAEQASFEWTREGYFQDENENMLSVTWMEDIDEPGWYVGCMLGEDWIEDSWGGTLPQKGSTLHGALPSSGSKDDITVTVSEEGEDGLLLVVEGGETYHYQSAQVNLGDPATYTFAAAPEAGSMFVKWTKNGEDFSTEPVITVLLDESAEFVAVFEEDPGWQNPVMNFIGEYQSDRAHALVECSGTEDALITIEWGGSAAELARWDIFGRLNTETLTINYSGVTKSIVTYDDSGEIVSQEPEYEDGTGTITFNDDGTFTWHEDQSEYGVDMVFEWVPVQGD